MQRHVLLATCTWALNIQVYQKYALETPMLLVACDKMSHSNSPHDHSILRNTRTAFAHLLPQKKMPRERKEWNREESSLTVLPSSPIEKWISWQSLCTPYVHTEVQRKIKVWPLVFFLCQGDFIPPAIRGLALTVKSNTDNNIWIVKTGLMDKRMISLMEGEPLFCFCKLF